MLLFGAAVALAQPLRHLVCAPVSAPTQQEDWTEQSSSAWMEAPSSGPGTRFTVIEPKSVLHGVSGETVIDPGRTKVFIPDAGVAGPYAKVMYYIDLSGDTGEWQVLGIFTERR